MSIYIKGMEMPTSCVECYFAVHCLCALTKKDAEDWFTTRPDYCPLIPVPEHGRLIDADALPWDDPIHSVRLHGGEQWISAYKIATAPTIIPADKEGA